MLKPKHGIWKEVSEKQGFRTEVTEFLARDIEYTVVLESFRILDRTFRSFFFSISA